MFRHGPPLRTGAYEDQAIKWSPGPGPSHSGFTEFTEPLTDCFLQLLNMHLKWICLARGIDSLTCKLRVLILRNVK